MNKKIVILKAYYSKQLKEELNAIIISPDEATYELLNNEQGEFYDIFSNGIIIIKNIYELLNGK